MVVSSSFSEASKKNFLSLTRIVHGLIGLLTLFGPRTQTFRVNLELSTDYQGQKTLFSSQEITFEHF